MNRRTRVIIMGAAGRDFHNFNLRFRNNEDYEVIAFTATQIPKIEGRVYPPELTGSLYPQGIPIYPEEELTRLIKDFDVQLIVFAYSDISHEYVMHKASEAMAAGADFILLGPKETTLKSNRPVIAVCAVRTGSGKSQTTRRVCSILRELGKKVVIVRHPMPYGDLRKQRIQRFETLEDLERHNCTIEEREDYEPHLARGFVLYAGIDYEEILREAEKEAELIVWDGGNNDFPFFKPDLHIVVVDPHRVGHELSYHPGETNLRLADIVVINKVDTAEPEKVVTLKENVRKVNLNTTLVEAFSPILVEDENLIRGKRVLVVEDGPTLTHGEMGYGAGILAAKKFGALEIVDPRPFAVNTIRATLEKYPHIGPLLPAMGYGKEQMEELETSINATPCDSVLIATPVDLRRFLRLNKPGVKVNYELKEQGKPDLTDLLRTWLQR